MPTVEKALDLTAVAPIRDWVKRLFALKTDVPANTADLTNNGDGTNNNSPFATQAYVATQLPSNTSDLVNDGDGTDRNSPFATQAYVRANGGKIDKIKVNSTEQTIDPTDKSVNITVPTAVSDLTNDSGFQTATQVQTAIDTALTSAMNYKGSVATYNDLPSSGNKTGDFYNVTDTGANYAWTGSAWDKCGDIVDMSTVWMKSELTFATVSEVEAVLNASSS